MILPSRMCCTFVAVLAIAAPGVPFSQPLFAETALPPMPTPTPQAVSAALEAGTTAPSRPTTPASPVASGIVAENTPAPKEPAVSSPSAPNGSSATGDQVGYASWYGSRFHGKLTANGEVYDMNKLTAANKTLPFGTVVRVTNLENGKSVDVTINDRGPFVAGRIIDLSRAAAEAIGLMSMGVGKVRLHILKMGDNRRVTPTAAQQIAASSQQTSAAAGTSSELPLIVQLGAFRDLGNAVRLKDFLDKNGFDPLYEKSGDVTRVVLVSVPQGELASVRTRLSKIGIDSILVRQE